ncbi:MAG TPA: SDR family NAD(P)-dependent oxidoreductase, partial [Umezawaea sp.]|nr:SDR family NAD(P)-dependent oxidoreductase [Umezawaea sp.]
VAASEADVAAVLAETPGRIGVAAVNGPRSVVVSGEEAAVEYVVDVCGGRGLKTRRLRVSHAFHSPLMEEMLPDFEEALSRVRFQPPVLPVVSNVSGRLGGSELSTPQYWVRHVREAVRFADGVAELHRSGVRTVLELGPDGSLSAMGQQALPDSDLDTAFLPVLRRKKPEAREVVSAVATAFARGHDVDWGAFFHGVGARPVDLPTYAFRRDRFWLTGGRSGDASAEVGLRPGGHPLLGARVDLSDSDRLVLTGLISTTTTGWLADHAVVGAVLFPGTGFLELALHAGDQAGVPRVEELTLSVPLVLPPSGGVRIQVRVGAPDADGTRAIGIASQPAGESAVDRGWTDHATGVLAPARGAGPASTGAWPPEGATPADVADLYERFTRLGLDYGPTFRGLRSAWTHGGEVYAEIAAPDEEHMAPASYGLHPALLDAALQSGYAATGQDDHGHAALPFTWSGAELHAGGATSLRVRLTPLGVDALRLRVEDPAGRPVVTVDSLVLRPVSTDRFSAARLAVEQSLYRTEWQPAQASDGNPSAAEPVTATEPLAGWEAFLATTGRVPETVLLHCGALFDAEDAIPAATHRATTNLLLLLQNWLADDRLASSRLVVVTRGAAGPVPASGASALVGAAVWGLVLSAQAEHPGRFRLVDDDGTDEEALSRALASEEPQLSLRAGTVLVPRLSRPAPGLLSPPAEGGAWRLDSPRKGTLEHLALIPAPEATAPLAAGEVRIAVRAAGLNFRDVLNALDMYPGDAGAMGLEGAGRIVEVGPDVTGFAVGDRVLGLFGGAFGPLAVADHRMVVPMPAGWSFADAASVPVVFLTAYHALVELASLRAGESVLVHAAASGVGMAAVQLARHLGASVHATASPGKWHTLRSLGVDADAIASSRDLGFEQVFRDRVGDRGVDVVLNSLAGEHVDASLRLTRDGGRFLEMGKSDIRDADVVGAAHRGVRYRAFDLTEAGPERIGAMLRTLLDLFARGALTPLPVTTWDVRRGPEAYRWLSQARHTGKLVLTLPVPFDAGGTALVTGGTGAIGRLVARHLVTDLGARNLVLLSRRGDRADGAEELRDELTALGADVTVVAGDAGDPDTLSGVIGAIPADRPLTAVFHVAGALDDGLADDLTTERLSAVLRPKVDAAWRLHELTEHLDLSSFVLFSSVAGTTGSAGQANYAAANAFLDALAEHRHRLGLPATSLAWGPWSVSGGMVDRLATRDARRVTAGGMIPFEPDEGVAVLAAAAARPEATLVPVRWDHEHLAARSGTLPPHLRGLVRAPARQTAARTGPVHDERRPMVEVVRHEVAAVLGYRFDQVDPDQSFEQLGFDSLTSVELRNRLSTAIDRRLPATVVFEHPTVGLLARHLVTLRPDTRQAGALAPLFDRLCSAGRYDDAFAMVLHASAALDTFTADDEPAIPPIGVPLSSGAALPRLVCVPSVIAISGVHEYNGLAAAFRDERDVVVLRSPGFASGEPVPDSVAALVRVHVRALLAQSDSGPFVVVARSTGGLIAHAVVEALEERGVFPASLVLVDTPAPGSLDREALQAPVGRKIASVGADDASLLAMGAYLRVLHDWQPNPVKTPT